MIWHRNISSIFSLKLVRSFDDNELYLPHTAFHPNKQHLIYAVVRDFSY